MDSKIPKLGLTARDERDLLIMLVTKLDNIETLVENHKQEYKIDYEEFTARAIERNIEYKAEIDKILGQIKQLSTEFDKKFVSKESFQPVKAIVYGITGTSLMGVLYAILKLVNLGAK